MADTGGKGPRSVSFNWTTAVKSVVRCAAEGTWQKIHTVRMVQVSGYPADPLVLTAPKRAVVGSPCGSEYNKEWSAVRGAPLHSLSYWGQPAPGDGWLMRSPAGDVPTGTKYDA